MKPEEAKDILSDMRDQHLCFLGDSEIKEEWQKEYLKEALAFDSGAKALEKQIPKKVTNLKEIYIDFGNEQKSKVGAYGDCPICHSSLFSGVDYCNKCGQRLDWSK